jgi:hypothetical protein
VEFPFAGEALVLGLGHDASSTILLARLGAGPIAGSSTLLARPSRGARTQFESAILPRDERRARPEVVLLSAVQIPDQRSQLACECNDRNLGSASRPNAVVEGAEGSWRARNPQAASTSMPRVWDRPIFVMRRCAIDGPLPDLAYTGGPGRDS